LVGVYHSVNNASIFILWDPMSSQKLLQYKLYKIVRISKNERTQRIP